MELNLKCQMDKKPRFSKKSFAICVMLLLFHFAVLGQYNPASNAGGPVLSAATTIRNYSVGQKRLLAVSSAQFINQITENNLDKDSVMLMACKITGMPFLLPYSDGFADKISGGEFFINSGRITEAAQLVKKLKGEKQIELQLELGIWYLHQPGTHKKDLDDADFYIELASNLSAANKYIKWKNECKFLLGELYYQKGRALESKKIYTQLVSSGQKGGNTETVARACQCIGTLLPGNDPMKKAYYQRSFELYRNLKFKEKEAELLWNIFSCDVTINLNFMEKDLRQIIFLMQSTGFKHVLYAENVLAIALGRQGKYVDGFAYTKAAIENMKWSGIYAVAGSMYIRLGSLYESVGKNDEALLWYKKALDTRKTETRVFWYKSLFYATTLLRDVNPEASLSLMNTITSQFAPQSVWEQLQIFSIKGWCYEKLNKPGLADKNYMSFLKLSNKYPSKDSYGELAYTYLLIGNFYVSQSNLKKARLFLKRGITNPEKNVDFDAAKYSLLFRIDSLEGNYKSAMQNHIKYKLYSDSLTSIDQRQKLDELTVRYAAEKKDKDIKILRQHGALQLVELKQNKFTRNIMMAGTAVLLIILILLFSQFRLKQRTNNEMNKRNVALKRLVDEKEWLIKEVHHRVKNNLQIVISLLQSQAAYLETDALKAIETSQNRIYTMSLIHQKLYQSEDIQTINMAGYIPELIKYLKDSFDNSNKIDFKIKIDEINLDASIAIPLALIINEAVTNSIKYAFPDNRPGVISIFLHEQSESLRLELADHGIGMDKNLFNENSISLGFQLIKGLTKEIHGDVSIKSNNGVKITILFKKQPLEYTNLLENNILSIV
jgi:two-component sensor histidine kinase